MSNIIEERTMFSESVEDTIIAKMRDVSQKFSINASKDTVITGESGVRVGIAANVFVDKEGNLVDKVKLDLLEATNVQSFIENDLMTFSGDEILESGGMFYINATSPNGQEVSIKNDESLTLSIPTNNIIGDMNLFYGNYDKDGKLDWQQIKGEKNMKIDFNMVAVPINSLPYNDILKDTSTYAFNKLPVITKEIEKLLNPKYEGTFIATQEFFDRFHIHMLALIVNPDQQDVFTEVMDIYKKHINGNLWEADEEVVKHLTPYYIASIDKWKKEAEEENFLSKGFLIVGKIFWNVLESASKAKYTQPISFSKLGITKNTTKEDLLKKGMSNAEANKYLFMYKEHEKRKVIAANAQETKNNFEKVKHYMTSISKLGWVNIDRFLRDPACQESSVSFIVDGVENNKVKLLMVFPARNICIQAIKNEGNKYSFTNKSGMYRKLPIEEEAVIIGLSSSNGTPYFGSMKVNIPIDGEFTLKMQPSTLNEIKISMEKVLKIEKPSL
ncbi:MAG: hypothetical protein GY827_12745 [Cytophagales bacterium]|nr:hypothetical protein [Cytophagales bacterium]